MKQLFVICVLMFSSSVYADSYLNSIDRQVQSNDQNMRDIQRRNRERNDQYMNPDHQYEYVPRTGANYQARDALKWNGARRYNDNNRR